MERENNGTTNREPVLAYGAAAGVAGAVLGVLVAFGVGIDDDQARALLTLVAALAPFVPALLVARGKVKPVEPSRNPNLRR